VFRAGFCAIVGRPNVGKSTLLNHVLGEKLAVVTPKPQTTRNRILGVKNLPEAQLVLIDTPGVHRGKSSLNRYMVDEALNAAAECDVILYLIEAPRISAGKMKSDGISPGPAEQVIIDKLGSLARGKRKAKIVLGVNKIDQLHEKDQLLPVLAAWGERLPLVAAVPISAKTGDGVEGLISELARQLPAGEALYPEEMFTDRAERFRAGELVREQLFLRLGEEVPYSTAVSVENWQERKDKGDVVIDAVVIVERESQKRIVIGAGGQMIKDVGAAARVEIAKLLGIPVHLKLFVKIDPSWTSNPNALKRLGYE
jgi:GTP-binding protein Era